MKLFNNFALSSLCAAFLFIGSHLGLAVETTPEHFGFAAGTKVLIKPYDSNSYREIPIENVDKNDFVMSCADGVCTTGVVTTPIKEVGASALKLDFDNGRSIVMGINQKVLVEESQDKFVWKAASELFAGDIVIGPTDQKAELVEITPREDIDLFTFEVIPHHTYCVDLFWVHNPQHQTTVKVDGCVNIGVAKGCASVEHTTTWSTGGNNSSSHKPSYNGGGGKFQGHGSTGTW